MKRKISRSRNLSLVLQAPFPSSPMPASPNTPALSSSLSQIPFMLTANIIALTALDFLGYGLPPNAASLGELLLQGKNNLDAPWLVLSGFFSLALVLSLLLYIGEAAREAFDPRR